MEALARNPKLEAGDYGDLVRALKKVREDAAGQLEQLGGQQEALLWGRWWGRTPT